MINAAMITLSRPIHRCLTAHAPKLQRLRSDAKQPVVQADEIITIVDGLCGSRLAAVQGCFKRSIRRQSRR
jgi:hypothetical protein